MKATAVKQLCTAKGLNRFIHPMTLDDDRFLSFGKRWCCKLCQRYVTDDKLPPTALANLSSSPWLQSLQVLKQLSSVERDLVTGYQPSDKIAQLKEGLSGRAVKTLNILSSQAEGRGVSSILASIALPAGFKVQLWLEESKSAFRHLLDVSKRHKTLLDDGLTQEFVSRTFDLEANEFEQQLATEVEGGQISQASLPAPPVLDKPNLDWFCKAGPCLSKIESIVVPDLDPSLPPDWSTFVARGPNAIYTGLLPNALVAIFTTR